MRKIKINLSGLKNQNKEGIAKLYFGDDVLEIPLSLKDDRKSRQLSRLSDIKYLTRLSDEGKLSVTKAVKISQIKPELREIIMQSEGYSTETNSYIKVYDETVLDMLADDRGVMLQAISTAIHIDFDYIVDDSTSLTFLGYINETFKDDIIAKYQKPLEAGDYYRIVEFLFEIGIFSSDTIMELNFHILALRKGTSYNEEKWGYEARYYGINEQEYIQMKKEEQELKLLLDNDNSKPYIEETVVDIEVKDEKKSKSKSTKKIAPNNKDINE